MAETKYIKWQWRIKYFDWWWHSIWISISLIDLLKLPVSEKWFVQIKVQSKRDTDERGNTHYIAEDEYDPKWLRHVDQDCLDLSLKLSTWTTVKAEIKAPEPEKEEDMPRDVPTK